MSGQSKRLSFWKGLSVGEIVFLLVASLLVLCALWWIIKVDHRFWRTNAGSALFTIGFIAGICAIFFSRLSAKRVVLVSACPLCGAVARRVFSEQDTRFPEPCRTCPAYLRIKGDELIEESLDETNNADYEVPPRRYLPAARPGPRDGFQFKMPQICAACGSSEVTQRREIGNWNKPKSDSNVLGAVVSVAAEVADVPSFSAHDYGQMGTRMQDRNWPKQDELDRKLEEILVPVCAGHAHGSMDALRFDSGKLIFRSYRYYKEFLRLNGIDGSS